MLPLTSMGKKDISSSDGENGAKAIDKGASISVVPSSSRKLPSWAGTSHFNLKSKSSGTSQMQSMQTKFTSNSTKNVRKSKDSAKIFELEDQSRTREHLCFENTDRSSSVNIPGNRRLPYSLMKDESAKEMSGSEFGKNIQHIQGRECKMSGIERLEVHLQTQPGVGSHFDNHELHKDGKEDFQVCGDLLSVPGQEPSSQQMLQRNLQPSIDPSLSRSNSKASIETKDVVLDKHRSHTNANSKAYMETTCLVPDKHGLSHSQLDGENVQSNSPPSTWHTTRTYSISTQPSLSVSVSKPSKKTGGISMDDQLAEDPVLEVDRKSSSQQMLRRVLPPSLQPAVSKSQSRAFKQAEVYGHLLNFL